MMWPNSGMNIYRVALRSIVTKVARAVFSGNKPMHTWQPPMPVHVPSSRVDTAAPAPPHPPPTFPSS